MENSPLQEATIPKEQTSIPCSDVDGALTYDQSLSQMEDGSLLYMRGDGSYLIFDKNEDGSYTTPDGYVYDLKAVTWIR